MEVFQYLADWYENQCNRKWDSKRGISLRSLDRPGWLLKVDLVGTDLEHTPFQPVRVGVTDKGQPEEPVWMTCRVHEGQFIAACSPDMLSHALDTFQLWSSLYAEN